MGCYYFFSPCDSDRPNVSGLCVGGGIGVSAIRLSLRMYSRRKTEAVAVRARCAARREMLRMYAPPTYATALVRCPPCPVALPRSVAVPCRYCRRHTPPAVPSILPSSHTPPFPLPLPLPCLLPPYIPLAVAVHIACQCPLRCLRIAPYVPAPPWLYATALKRQKKRGAVARPPVRFSVPRR